LYEKDLNDLDFPPIECYDPNHPGYLSIYGAKGCPFFHAHSDKYVYQRMPVAFSSVSL